MPLGHLLSWSCPEDRITESWFCKHEVGERWDRRWEQRQDGNVKCFFAGFLPEKQQTSGMKTFREVIVLMRLRSLKEEDGEGGEERKGAGEEEEGEDR